MENIIIFIDDDPARIEPYKIALKTAIPDCRLEFFQHPEHSVAILKNESASIACIILDVMFVPQSAAHGGIDRGIIFYDSIKGTNFSDSVGGKSLRTTDEREEGVNYFNKKNQKIVREIPVIILTNRKHQNMPGFGDFVKSKGDYLLEKPNCLPSELATFIKERFFEMGNNPHREKP